MIDTRGADAAYKLVLEAARVEDEEREQMRAAGISEESIGRETFGYCSCADPTARTYNGAHPIHRCEQ